MKYTEATQRVMATKPTK